MKVLVKTLVLLLPLFVVGKQRAITVTISDLKTLEEDLLRNGMDSRAVEVIYSAASCNLKRDIDLNKRLDQLIGPVERMQASINQVLNKLSMSSRSTEEPEGTLELLVRHSILPESIVNRSSEVESMDVKQRVRPAFMSSNQAEYLPMGSKIEEIDPDMCKTYEVVKDLIIQSKERKHGILKIAHRVYGFSGPNSISGLTRFYQSYVATSYDERMKVMGLAKILGDFASIVSEAYFLETALLSKADSCGISMESSHRRKRNVMQSMIGSGNCVRRFGTWDPDVKDISFLSSIPFRDSIRKTALAALGTCNDDQASWNGVVEKGVYRSALSASFKTEVLACVKLAICPKNTVFDGVNCIDGKPVGDFSNVDKLELSVLSGRVQTPVLPDELKSLSKKYCSIQGKVVHSGKECAKPIKMVEKFVLFSIGGVWYFTDKDLLIAHGQDTSNICFYNCNEGCSGGCMECKGDETYESIFGKWPKSNCTCSYCEDCSDIYMQIESAKIGVDAVMHASWDVTIPVESEKEVKCSGCKAMCNGRILKIERDMKFDIIHLCVGENCRIIDESEVDFTYEIPNDLLHVVNLHIVFFRSDGLGKDTVEVTCFEPHACKTLHCDVCLQRFANPHCYKFLNWLILATIASLSIVVIPILCLAFKLSKFALYIVLSPAKFLLKLLKVMFKKCTSGSKTMATATGRRIARFVDEEEALEPSPRRKSNKLIVSLVLITIAMLPLSKACENVIALDSSVSTCLPSTNGQIKCAVNTIVELPLSSIGEESCINLMSQNGGIAQTVKVKTLTIRQKCSKNVLYYTADATFKLVNTFRCRNAGECVDDACEKIKPSGPAPVPAMNEDKAGYYGCQRVTGFWGKGCFYASQACQFYKVELFNSKGVSYEVSKCSEWFWEIKLELTISDKDTTRNESVLIDTTLPVKSSIGFFQLLSVNTPNTILTSKCFLRRLSSNMKTAIVDCADRNNPIPGKIGTIQCSTPTLAEKSSKSCLIDAKSIQIIPQDDNVVFINRFVNTTKEWRENLLPSNVSSAVVSEDASGQIYIHYTGSSLYNVRVRMEDYKISYSIVKATCEAHFRKIGGCANCGTGAMIEVEVVLDNASRAPVSLKCPSSRNPGVELALSSSPLTKFKMAFNHSEIDEECTLSCPGNDVSIKLEGLLLNNIKIRTDNSTGIISRGADFFASVPWFHFGFVKYLYLIIGVLVILPIFYTLYILFVRCLGCVRKVAKKPSMKGTKRM